MIIFPAIDIIQGKPVRLYRGDYNAVKNYDISCEQAASAFKAQGATHIHIVDLDGAKSGVAENADAVKRIMHVGGFFAEVGGGIRTQTQIEMYLSAGAGRVILGTAAIRDFDFTVDMIKRYGDSVAIGVDAADGKVAVQGWKKVTDTDSVEFCKRLAEFGAHNVIYTDISRDGTLLGTNLDVYSKLVRINGLKITASGGISSLSDIISLRDMGVHSAIIGKALYENKLSLFQAIDAACAKESV